MRFLDVDLLLKKRCPLCLALASLLSLSKFDKSTDVQEIKDLEFMHNEFWMCQRDLARTYESVVESWSDDGEHLYEGLSKKDTCEVIQYGP